MSIDRMAFGLSPGRGKDAAGKVPSYAKNLLLPLPVVGTGDCVSAFLCITDLSVIYRSGPLCVLRKRTDCGHSCPGWPRAHRISVCINCGFCYAFSLRSSKLKQEVSKIQSSMLADLSFQENKNLTEAWKIVPFVWDKPPTSLFMCKRFPVCEN